jgi:hypothetical protein
MSESSPSSEPEVLTNVMLGTQATYRVIERTSNGHVKVAVIEAPGLAEGYEFAITAEAAAGMDSSLNTQESDLSSRSSSSTKALPAT